MRWFCLFGRLRVLGLVALALGCMFLSAGLARAESFDWRDVGGLNFVSPVRSQFGGTCWAFADIASLEAKYMLTRNDPQFAPDLSEQQIVWETDPDMGSTHGGGPFVLAFNYFATHGVVSEAECPYQPSSPDIGIPPYWPLADGWEDRVWIAASYEVDFATSLQKVKDGLRQYGPLTINMSVDDDWYDPPPGSPRGGHAVLMVGFHDDASVPGGGYWIVKNSWGTGWNDAGYGKISYDRRPAVPGDANALTGPVYYTGPMVSATWKGASGTWRQWGSYWTSEGSTYLWRNQETSATFGGTGGTVSLTGTVIAHGMTINSGATGYSFTGGTGLTLTAGGITANESTAISTPVTMGAPQTWNVAGGKTLTLNGPIHTVINDLTLAGAGNVTINDLIDGGGVLNTYGAKLGSLIKANTGSLTLTGVSYENDFTLQSGTLYITPAGGASAAFNGALYGNRPIVINSTGPVGLAGPSDYSGTISLTSTGALQFLTDSGVTATYSGVISGSGEVSQDGPGTTILSGVNTYTGTTRIGNGALQATVSRGIPSGVFLSLEGGVLQSNGSNLFTRSLGTSGERFQWSGSGGGFSGGLGSMTVRINDGTETLNWGTNVGSEIVGTLKLSSSSAYNITDFQNGINLGGADRTIQVDDNPSTSNDYAAISGPISGGPGSSLTKTGSGKLCLTGSLSNTYSGTTTLLAGDLELDKFSGYAIGGDLVLSGDAACLVRFMDNNQMPSTARWIWNHDPASESYQEIELLGHNQTVAGISDNSGYGVIQNTSNDTTVAPCTLTVDNSTDCAFNGHLRNGAVGGVAPLRLVKDGTATLTLSGDHITYSGGTTLLGGTLLASTGSALGAVGSDITVGPGATLQVASGTFDLEGGALLTNDGTLLSSLSVTDGAKAQGTGDFGAVTVSDNGIFSPGNSIGAATTGVATWGAGGKYLFEINDADGTAGVDWDLWNLSGDVSIASSGFTLAVETLSGTSPGLMADFDNTHAYSWLLASTATTISGSNDLELDTSLFQNPLAPCGRLQLSQTGDQWLYLDYLPSIAGDANCDGNVDEDDAQLLASNWGETDATWNLGDFDRDGVVGPSDAAILAANWGYSSGEATGRVPEPSILVMWAGMTVLCIIRRRRRRYRV